MPSATDDLEERILERLWFYRYVLPSGRSTRLYISDDVSLIHDTRREMMLAALAALFQAYGDTLTAIDLASHQGFFSFELARHCRHVLGLEYKREHVDAANLIKAVNGVSNVDFVHENVETMPSGKHEGADIVLMFGLLYNTENPIGVLRRARELTRKVLLDRNSNHHSGSRRARGLRPLRHHKHDVRLFRRIRRQSRQYRWERLGHRAVSEHQWLAFVLRKLGFQKIEVLDPPPGAYQQLATGKRIMVKAALG